MRFSVLGFGRKVHVACVNEELSSLGRHVNGGIEGPSSGLHPGEGVKGPSALKWS